MRVKFNGGVALARILKVHGSALPSNAFSLWYALLCLIYCNSMLLVRLASLSWQSCSISEDSRDSGPRHIVTRLLVSADQESTLRSCAWGSSKSYAELDRDVGECWWSELWPNSPSKSIILSNSWQILFLTMVSLGSSGTNYEFCWFTSRNDQLCK